MASFCTIKDLGPDKKCLGININRNRSEGIIKLDQEDYIQSLLKNFGMDECRKTSAPMEISGRSSNSPEQQIKTSDIPYQSAVGALLFLVQATRPDLAFAVSTISKYNNSYDHTHWSMIKRILRYLQGTKHYRLQYRKDSISNPIGYCDASYATDIDDPWSVTGYTFILAGCAISWNSKRQSTYAQSSTEAEYLSLLSTTQEAMWVRNICLELSIIDSRPITLYCDNEGAIGLGKNAQFSSRTKHISVRHHFIRDQIDKKNIEVIFTPSNEMVANALTKATNTSKLEDFREKIGLMKPKEKKEERK